MSDIEFTDRYKQLGIPYHEPETCCEGQCEGTGFYPQHENPNLNINLRLRLKGIARLEREAWEIEHRKAHHIFPLLKMLLQERKWWLCKSVLRDIFTREYRECDGYHFIKCADCSGTGKRTVTTARQKRW